MCGVDLFPSLCALAGAALPHGVEVDGGDLSRALLGEPLARTKPIFWCYNNTPKPGNPAYVTPGFAVRQGDWKLLVGEDGSGARLYDPAAALSRRRSVEKDPKR